LDEARGAVSNSGDGDPDFSWQDDINGA